MEDGGRDGYGCNVGGRPYSYSNTRHPPSLRGSLFFLVVGILLSAVMRLLSTEQISRYHSRWVSASCVVVPLNLTISNFSDICSYILVLDARRGNKKLDPRRLFVYLGLVALTRVYCLVVRANSYHIHHRPSARRTCSLHEISGLVVG